ncbi:ribonuclease H-like domain-containing protein [Tanacetum coccineum]
MTGPSVTATTTLSDKLALVTHHHLLTWVLVKLDFDEWNYGSWEYMFDQLCESYEVSKFIHGDSSGTSTDPPPPFTPEELKVDKIILSWIFITLSDALQKRLVIARPKTAKEAWSFLSDLLKDHKKSRTSALKMELRTIKLGDLSMEAYFKKVESLMTTPASLNSPVSDDDVVHYVIDGLPEMYNQAQPSAPPGFVTWPTDNTGQTTMLPQAFTVGTLHDLTIGAWNMDTGSTSSSSPKVMNRDTEVTKDTMLPTNNKSTEDVQPPVVQVQSQNLTSKPVVDPVSVPMPNQRTLIPFANDSIQIEGMFLSQRKYATKILEWDYLVGCKSSRTPVDTESKLGVVPGVEYLLLDPTSIDRIP